MSQSHGDPDFGDAGHDAEELHSGSSHPRRPPRPATVVAAVVALIALILLVHGRSHHSTSAAPPPATSTAPVPRLPSGLARAAPPITSTVKLPLLGVTSGWELFGRGPTDVVRIEFARGVVTRTTIPALASSGPISFDAGPQGALIRPLDFVPGYRVPDGHFAGPLPAPLRHGGQLLPGPRLGQFWVEGAHGSKETMSLVGRDGKLTGARIRLPVSQASLVSDGDGYLLAFINNRVYDARPGRLRELTGDVQAVGPTGVLALSCDRNNRCQNVMIDPRNGRRSVLGREVDSDTGEPIGSIAADGRVAAVPNPLSDGPGTVRLVNLATGVGHTLRLALPDQNDFDTELAFSPDSRWLFAATATGKLDVVPTGTGRIRSLGVALPQVSQLVIRPALHQRRAAVVEQIG